MTRKFDDILLRYCNDVYNQNTIDRCTKGCILPFPKKGDFRIAKNYRGITLTSIAAKIYNARLHYDTEPKIEKILRKNQNCFRRNFDCQVLEAIRTKNLEATLLFDHFSKTFVSIHSGKVEQILLAYSLPKETITFIMKLYKNTKVRRWHSASG